VIGAIQQSHRDGEADIRDFGTHIMMLSPTQGNAGDARTVLEAHGCGFRNVCGVLDLGDGGLDESVVRVRDG